MCWLKFWIFTRSITSSWVKVQNFQILNFRNSSLTMCIMPKNVTKSSKKCSIILGKLKINQRSNYNLSNSGFWGWLSMESQPQDPMESQPQNPEFRNNPWKALPMHHWDATKQFCLFVWFDSLCPINNLSVKQGRVFLGWTSTKLG